jgi:hypothetical protein
MISPQSAPTYIAILSTTFAKYASKKHAKMTKNVMHIFAHPPCPALASETTSLIVMPKFNL